jgi:hypothetical protein
VTVEGVLQCGGSDGREECRYSRQVKEVCSAVLLRKPDGGNTCTYSLAWSEKRKSKGSGQTDLDKYREGVGDRFYVFADLRYKIMQISLDRWIPNLACINKI